MYRFDSPYDAGMPERFSSWRLLQDVAFQQICNTSKRFVAQVIPTGGGKSVTYMAAALQSSGRTVILTSTKGLQQQLLRDFAAIGAVDIRGKNNYTCRLNSLMSCDAGICNFGVNCRMRNEGGCEYYDQLTRAKSAKIVITNYAYWFVQNAYGGGIGNFDMLILDEAHAAPDQLLSYTSAILSRTDSLTRTLLHLDESTPNTAPGWQEWAEESLVTVEAALGDAKIEQNGKKFHTLKQLKLTLEKIANIDNTWAWEDRDHEIELCPMWPAPYAEVRLFCGIQRVVLTSATLTTKTLSMLGIKEADYEEYPHTFPVENRRIIHLPTVAMSHRTAKTDEVLWLARVEQIIKARLQQKGIIHTVSYTRRDLIRDKSTYTRYMVTHQRRNTEQTVTDFKQASAPKILVSPSMATGWDFPDAECRWQIIIKVPYPDISGVIIKRRMALDPEWVPYLTAQQLIQACGRGVRAADDWCDTFILDNNIMKFIARYRHLFPVWWLEAFSREITIPTLKE